MSSAPSGFWAGLRGLSTEAVGVIEKPPGVQIGVVHCGFDAFLKESTKRYPDQVQKCARITPIPKDAKYVFTCNLAQMVSTVSTVCEKV